MSGVLGQMLPRKKSETGGLEISVEVGSQLGLGGAPCEVGVRLGEAGLGEGVGDVGARECLGEEDGVGCAAQDLGDAPLPKGEGFGVGVVDAEDTNAVLGPKEEDVA